MNALASLQDQPRWIAWRNEPRGKEQKITKVPYGTRGNPAKADDATTWLSHSDAQKLADRIVNGTGGGLGIQLGDLGDGWSLGGVDLDTCREHNGAIAPWAVEVIKRFDSYTEISPSETGVKIFFQYQTDDLEKLRPALGGSKYGRQFKLGNGKDHPPAIEVYLVNRYFAVTGRGIDLATNEMMPVHFTDLIWLLTKAGPAFAGARSEGQIQLPTASVSTDNSRSGAAFRLARDLRRGGANYLQFVVAARNNPQTSEWCREKGETDGQRELRRAWERATPSTPTSAGSNPRNAVTIEDFHAYMPMHSYIYVPTRSLWPAGSVNSRIDPIAILDKDGQPKMDDKGKIVMMPAANWLDRHSPVEQMTWVPGMPEIIEDKLLYEGGWIHRKGVRAFNQYLAPSIVPAANGDERAAGRWLDHVRLVYPDGADHVLDWLAHRVQHPGEKINHALVMGGSHGIGKDTILEPVKQAIGPWNFAEVSPGQITGRFNGFVKSVILRISEARDLGEMDRFGFYDHTKTLISAPPDTIRVDEKFLKEHQVVNCCGVIITTNHKTDGIYLPAEDRRHYVAWSDVLKEDPRFAGSYWQDLYTWFANGGNEAVAAYLMARDISGFDAKAPPPQTAAFWTIVDSNRPQEEGEMSDVIDMMNGPEAMTLYELQKSAENDSGLSEWLLDRKNRRAIPHRLERCGYVPVRNPYANDGMWVIAKKRQVVYVRNELSAKEKITAAEERTKHGMSGETRF